MTMLTICLITKKMTFENAPLAKRHSSPDAGRGLSHFLKEKRDTHINVNDKTQLTLTEQRANAFIYLSHAQNKDIKVSFYFTLQH